MRCERKASGVGDGSVSAMSLCGGTGAEPSCDVTVTFYLYSELRPARSSQPNHLVAPPLVLNWFPASNGGGIVPQRDPYLVHKVAEIDSASSDKHRYY